MGLSLRDEIKLRDEQSRKEWVASLPPNVVAELATHPWWFIGRPEQQPPPGDWSIWLILSGRGWGKTRTGAEWLVDSVLQQPKAPDGSPTEWAIIAERFADAKNICVEGPSGVLKVLARRGLKNETDFRYNKSSWQIFFKDGQRVHMFGADDEDAGRGLNLAGAWLDEMAMWRYPDDSWAQGIAPALRIGNHPRAVVTTTPKPIRILREWVKREDGSVYVTRGSTFDNAANLSEAALLELRARYEGTRVGRQELYGEILDDIEGALWTLRNIDDNRVTTSPERFARIVIGIDPAVTNNEGSDETGIIVAGTDLQGQGYVIADYSMKGQPIDWAQRVVDAYDTHEADSIVVEVNNGGDMIATVLRQIRHGLPIKQVRASRGKQIRAEPIATMYQQNRIHHIGAFQALEDQLTSWTPEMPKSPDRMDALVWAFSELMLGASVTNYLSHLAAWCPQCNLPMPKHSEVCGSCGATLVEHEHILTSLGR